ncbi:hypothetical protein GCM10027589_57440 [Actinocorallia lasiicapitis]
MTSQGNKPVAFIGGPFKALVSPDTGLFSPEMKDRLQRLIAHYEDAGWFVLNAHREEGWGQAMVPAAECTSRDLAWMRACDLFVAFPGHPASPGTHVEIGWASALARPTILLLEARAEYAALVTGLDSVAPVAYLTYDAGPAFFADLAVATAELTDGLRADAADRR